MSLISRFKQKIVLEYNERYKYPALVKGKRKIFCIGRNKTGTTSLKKAFEDLGYIVGNQRKAELLLDEYIAGDFEPIIRYCRTAQVFQDIPFSYPETYKHLDKAYSDSKFILSVRDSPEQWYHSLVKFHSTIYGDRSVPTADDLKNAYYIEMGRPWKIKQKVYNTPENDPYNKEIMINHYINHNAAVKDYFKGRPDDLIIINLSEAGSYQKLMDFLNIESPFKDFPWENKTAKMKVK